MAKAGRPPIDLEKALTKIAPLLATGLSLHKACCVAEISYSTLHPYYREDPDFRRKCDRYLLSPSVHARTTWIKAIRNGNWQAARDWLVKREPEEFDPHSQSYGDPLSDVDPLSRYSDDALGAFLEHYKRKSTEGEQS